MKKETIEIKSDLHDFIDNIDDFNLLKAIYLLISTNKNINKNKLSKIPYDLEIELGESIFEADRGVFISHKEAMRQITEKVENL